MKNDIETLKDLIQSVKEPELAEAFTILANDMTKRLKKEK